MSYHDNFNYLDESFKTHVIHRSNEATLSYLTLFDTRSLDQHHKSMHGSTPSSKSSTPSSGSERSRSIFDRMDYQQPETGSLKSHTKATSQRPSSYSTVSSTRPGTPAPILPPSQPLSKRATLPSSFKLTAIPEPKTQRRPTSAMRQSTLRAAGQSILEERCEPQLPEEDW